MNGHRKIRVATCSLAGCFGCHMSFLDMDERLIDLIEHIEFDRSPLTDIKHCKDCDLGLVEGGVGNAENVEVLREFRHHCRFLVSVGACAINGGIPAMRNNIPLDDVLAEVYLDRIGTGDACIPNDPELPLPFARVHPIAEIVRVDAYLPGCPPPADAFVDLLDDIAAGRVPRLVRDQIRFD